MAQYLISNKILSDSVTSGIKFLEKAEYKEAQNYLEFAYQSNTMYQNDQFVLYALTVIYYNLGKLKEAKEIIKKINNINNLNEQIEDMIKQIEKDLKRTKEVKTREEVANLKERDMEYYRRYIKILKTLDMSLHNLKILGTKTEDKFYQFLIHPSFTGEGYELFKRISPRIEKSLNLEKKVFDLYINNKNPNFHEIYDLYNKSISNGHSIFIILANKQGLLNDLLIDPQIKMEFKNELIFDIKHYTNLGYIAKRVITFIDNKDNIVKLGINDLPNISIYTNKLEKGIKSTPVSDDKKVRKYVYAIGFKYLVKNYLQLKDLDVSDLLKRIFRFVYQTHSQLSLKIKDYFEKDLKLAKTDEKDIEIYKIVLSLEDFML